MQFNIIFKTIFEYIHKKIRFVHTNTFCKYRKKLRASPRVHLVTAWFSMGNVRAAINNSEGFFFVTSAAYVQPLYLTPNPKDNSISFNHSLTDQYRDRSIMCNK